MHTPVPEVIQSLPPVTIQHMAEGPNPWWTFIGSVAIAFSALVVALITLRQVYKQIAIATKQLGLATEELAAVKEDLALALEIRSLAERSPNLLLTVTPTASKIEETENHQMYRSIVSELIVENRGNRVAKNVVVEVLVPELFVFQHGSVGIVTDFQRRNSIRYAVWSFGEGRLKIPIGERYEAMLRINLRPDLDDLTLYWRVYDEDFAYPTNELGTQRLALTDLS